VEELLRLLGNDYRIFRLDGIGRVKYTNFDGNISSFIDIIKFDERAKAAKLFMQAMLNGSSEGNLMLEKEKGYELHHFRFVKNDDEVIAIGKKIEDRVPAFSTDYMGNVLSASDEWSSLLNKNIFEISENKENIFTIVTNAIEYGEYEGKVNINGKERRLIVRPGNEIEFYIEDDVSEFIWGILSSRNIEDIVRNLERLLDSMGYEEYFIRIENETVGVDREDAPITIPFSRGVIKIYDGTRKEILSALPPILNFSLSNTLSASLIMNKFAVYGVDEDGNIIYINEKFEEMMGYGKEIIGRNISEFCNEHEKNMKDGIFKWRTPLSEIYVKEYIMPVNGVIYSIIFDVTEERDAMREAEFYNSLLRHDIYNKNQIAMGYLGLLKKTNTTKKQKELLEKTIKAIDEGNKLIESVRKMEEIKKNARIRKVRLNPVVKNICSSLEEAARANSIEIEYENLNSTIIADDFVGEIFLNIIGNAIEHSGAKHIRIYGIDEEITYTVVVEDDGKGIEKEDMKRIFEEGWKKNSRGSGIGLYIVKKLMNRYGGKIEVESEVGKGCKFKITFRKARGKDEFLRIRF